MGVCTASLNTHSGSSKTKRGRSDIVKKKKKQKKKRKLSKKYSNSNVNIPESSDDRNSNRDKGDHDKELLHNHKYEMDSGRTMQMSAHISPPSTVHNTNSNPNSNTNTNTNSNSNHSNHNHLVSLSEDEVPSVSIDDSIPMPEDMRVHTRDENENENENDTREESSQSSSILFVNNECQICSSSHPCFANYLYLHPHFNNLSFHRQWSSVKCMHFLMTGYIRQLFLRSDIIFGEDKDKDSDSGSGSGSGSGSDSGHHSSGSHSRPGSSSRTHRSRRMISDEMQFSLIFHTNIFYRLYIHIFSYFNMHASAAVAAVSVSVSVSVSVAAPAVFVSSETGMIIEEEEEEEQQQQVHNGNGNRNHNRNHNHNTEDDDGYPYWRSTIVEWYEMKSVFAMLESRAQLLRPHSYISPIFHLELLYCGTRDGFFKLREFHRRCDGQGPTFTIISAQSGNIFGGFTSISWSSQYGYIYDSTAFLCLIRDFFDKRQSVLDTPCKIFEQISNLAEANIIHDPHKGPVFGSGPDISIELKCNTRRTNSLRSASFERMELFGNEDGKFQVKNIEVYRVFGL